MSKIQYKYIKVSPEIITFNRSIMYEPEYGDYTVSFNINNLMSIVNIKIEELFKTEPFDFDTDNVEIIASEGLIEIKIPFEEIK